MMQVWGRACDFIFLTIPQVMLMLPTQGLHFGLQLKQSDKCYNEIVAQKGELAHQNSQLSGVTGI